MRWRNDWSKVRGNPHGVTGWATVVRGDVANLAPYIRIHVCAHAPCKARYPANKYGHLPPPYHVAVKAAPPPCEVAEAPSAVAEAPSAAAEAPSVVAEAPSGASYPAHCDVPVVEEVSSDTALGVAAAPHPDEKAASSCASALGGSDEEDDGVVHLGEYPSPGFAPPTDDTLYRQ